MVLVSGLALLVHDLNVMVIYYNGVFILLVVAHSVLVLTRDLLMLIFGHLNLLVAGLLRRLLADDGCLSMSQVLVVNIN